VNKSRRTPKGKTKKHSFFIIDKRCEKRMFFAKIRYFVKKCKE